MTKLILIQGIPASGKSTKAKELREEINGIKISRDDLRDMLHGEGLEGENFDNNLQKDLKEIEMIIAGYYLGRRISVVIDDTNLTDYTIKEWKNLAKNLDVEFSIYEMNTPYDVCIKRNSKRENPVPKKDMQRMWLVFKNLKKEKENE